MREVIRYFIYTVIASVFALAVVNVLLYLMKDIIQSFQELTK